MAELQFKIDGPALEQGVPIHLAVSALDNFQTIVDKTYLVSIDAQRMSSRERERFYLKATTFEEGSLLTVFEIVLQGVQLGLPLVSVLGPQNIWDYTQETFKFLKLVCGAVQNRDKPSYKFDNTGDVTVQVGDIEHHYHGPVIQIGQLALKDYQDLAHLIDPNKLTEISAGRHRHEPDIFLGEEDKGLFDVPTRLEEETVELRCEIFDFNKYKNIGKLSVSVADQEVPPGEYNFSIFGDQDNVEYIYSMLKPEVELHCLVEVESSPFGGEQVSRLYVTGVAS